MDNDSKKISANEINKYCYCNFSWYYERYYGKKYLREKHKERNEKLGLTDTSLSNFSKGQSFHNQYLKRQKIRGFIKFMIYIILVIVLLFIAIFLSKPDIEKKKSSIYGMNYSLIYSDARQKGLDIDNHLLYSKKYDLTGKPDFIYKCKFSRKIFVAELKSGNIGDKQHPYKGDLMQLAAYFLIIKDEYGIKPTEGRLIYNDYMFIVKNRQVIRKEVKVTISEMRTMLDTGEGYDEHSFVKCRYCMCKGVVCENENENG